MFAVTKSLMRHADRIKIEKIMKSYNNSVNTEINATCQLMLKAATAIVSYIGGYNNILILCGGGNNGGDGYALASILHNNGINCVIVAVLPVKTAAANYYKCLCESRNIEILHGLPLNMGEFDCIVDCVYGVGFHGELPNVIADIFKAVNHSSALKVACDIPSGLNADNGIADRNVFNANITVVLGAYKVGCFLSDGKDCCGDVYLDDLGITSFKEIYEIADSSHIKKVFPKRKNNTNKGDFGSLIIVANSQNFIGAGLLSYAAAVNTVGESALRTGCGYCRLSVPDDMQIAMQRHALHCCLLPRKDLFKAKATAIAVGMGLNTSDCDVVRELITISRAPLLIDASALTILAVNLQWLSSKSCDILITPHPGEFARLCGVRIDDVINNPIELARQFAKKYGITVYLKGASSIVTDGERVGLVINGKPSLAKGGSGDVLSGVISAIMARGVDAYSAAIAGGYICAEAANALDINEYSVAPMDVALAINKVLQL